jgi:hypothetical protein
MVFYFYVERVSHQFNGLWILSRLRKMSHDKQHNQTKANFKHPLLTVFIPYFTNGCIFERGSLFELPKPVAITNGITISDVPKQFDQNLKHSMDIPDKSLSVTRCCNQMLLHQTLPPPPPFPITIQNAMHT